ncbi:MAG: 50S ribosomal protein L35 [Terriglobia bacterium]
MPKMKGHSGASKRFKVTKNKKIMRKRANKGHLLSKKSAQRKRRLGKPAQVSSADKNIRKLLAP